MERLNAGRFDVLLTDLNLPGVSGLELAKRALAVHPDIHVVLASGDELPDNSMHGFPCAKLRKPYTVDDLDHVLRVIQRTLHANRR
ncbi:hypothetical protein [Paraburkholderia xenovorans]|jgi:CheY-like chemotaxis protein|uniref:hypothetical protein n=1 Tax=Paraburkholderia xenovorans TaxID=36873 RepID=UPI00031E9268